MVKRSIFKVLGLIVLMGKVEQGACMPGGGDKQAIKLIGAVELSRVSSIDQAEGLVGAQLKSGEIFDVFVDNKKIKIQTCQEIPLQLTLRYFPVVVKESEVVSLLMMHNQQHSVLHSIGGKRKEGETLQQALKREAEEEINVELDDEQIAGMKPCWGYPKILGGKIKLDFFLYEELSEQFGLELHNRSVGEKETETLPEWLLLSQVEKSSSNNVIAPPHVWDFANVVTLQQHTVFEMIYTHYTQAEFDGLVASKLVEPCDSKDATSSGQH